MKKGGIKQTGEGFIYPCERTSIHFTSPHFNSLQFTSIHFTSQRRSHPFSGSFREGKMGNEEA